MTDTDCAAAAYPRGAHEMMVAVSPDGVYQPHRSHFTLNSDLDVACIVMQLRQPSTRLARGRAVFVEVRRLPDSVRLIIGMCDHSASTTGRRASFELCDACSVAIALAGVVRASPSPSEQDMRPSAVVNTST